VEEVAHLGDGGAAVSLLGEGAEQGFQAFGGYRVQPGVPEVLGDEADVAGVAVEGVGAAAFGPGGFGVGLQPLQEGGWVVGVVGGDAVGQGQFSAQEVGPLFVFPGAGSGAVEAFAFAIVRRISYIPRSLR
jgi:hypothetical protein